MGGIFCSQSSTARASGDRCEGSFCLFRKTGPSAPPELREEALKGFETTFGGRPSVFGVAPGRAEVLGNHTDHSEGFILSCAIDRYILVAARKAPLERGSLCRLHSSTFPGFTVEFDAGLQPESFAKNKQQEKSRSWANYMIGVVSELRKSGCKVGGFDAYVTSTVPPGAAVSSSAALEMATAVMLSKLFPEQVGHLDQVALVKVAKAAENNFVGMGCGILDQFSSGMGKAGALLFLDCRTLDHNTVPFTGVQFVLANTHAPHSLVDGQYDMLRRHCEAAKDVIAKATGRMDITHLRDVSYEMLQANKSKLSKDQWHRALHVITENARVLEGVEACKNGDMEKLGKCMSASHASSRDDFGNSCRELDIMQTCAADIPGALGSRLMGGGFGGCTINLVKTECVEAFVEELSRRYQAQTNIAPSVFVCSPGDGAFTEVL
mmetsp:Transcript_75476/g.157416  ORF Transcript_75476/g.157416 Transcript_75476/m.157416 type:complete len:437 (-) Transcript_75476:664-1974(-)